MASVPPGFSGGTYWDKTQNKVMLDTNQRLDPAIYQKYVSWAQNRQSNPFNATNSNISDLAKQWGVTDLQLNAAKKQYDVERYNQNPTQFPDVEWNTTMPQYARDAQYGGLFDGYDTSALSGGTPTTSGTSPVSSTALTRNSATSRSQSTPRQATINPYNYNQVGQAVQPSSTGTNMPTSTRGGKYNWGTTMPSTATGQSSSGGLQPNRNTGNYSTGNTSVGMPNARNLNMNQAYYGNNAQISPYVTNAGNNYSTGNMSVGMPNSQNLNLAQSYGSTPQVSSYTQNTGTSPTLTTGNNSTYNPTPYSPQGTTNGYINSSGGFAYDNLPGMFNYLSSFLADNSNAAAGRADELTDFMGENITSGYPGGMSQYIQEMVNMLGSPQAEYGQNQQTAAANTTSSLANGVAPQTALQSQVGDQISQMLSGSGLTDEYVQAMRQSVLDPSQENLMGQLNRMGGGVVAPSSGLDQELLRRNESDFNNQLIKSGYENMNNLLTQGMTSGGQSYGQGLNLASLQGNLGQNAIQNSFNAMSQGGDLLNQYLGAGLGLQGNQQNYASNLSNQYGNLTSDYLKAYLSDQAMQNQNKQASNASTGSGIAGLLGSILKAMQGGKSGSSTGGGTGTSTGTGTGTGAGTGTSTGTGRSTGTGTYGGDDNISIPPPTDDPMNINDILNGINTGGSTSATAYDVYGNPLTSYDDWNSIYQNLFGEELPWSDSGYTDAFNSADPSLWTWDNVTNPDTSFDWGWDAGNIASGISGGGMFPTLDNVPGETDWINYGYND